MSLVIAFSGNSGAVMAGDRREIVFLGDTSAIVMLEEALSSGRISTDEQLQQSAKALGVAITIRDNKCKIREEDGILVGEVTETDGESVRRRRLCVTCGQYAIIEKVGPSWTMLSSGEGSHFLVLGNEATKAIANRCIREQWRAGKGTIEDAIRVCILSMQHASATTASVSRAFNVVQTRAHVRLAGHLPG